MNALAIDFDSIYSMEEYAITAVFKSIDSSEFRVFLSFSLDIYVLELKNCYGRGTITKDGYIFMPIEENNLLIDQGFFTSLFQLLFKGISAFFEVSQEAFEEMQLKFSSSSEAIKTTESKKAMKLEFKLLTDVVAKYVLEKAGSFAAIIGEKFLVITSITTGKNINWSAILFQTLKAVILSDRQSVGFPIPLSRLFEDARIPLSEPIHSAQVQCLPKILLILGSKDSPLSSLQPDCK